MSRALTVPRAREIPAVAAFVALAVLAACGGGDANDALPAQSWTLASDTLTAPGLHSQGLASLPERGSDVIAFTSRYTLDRTNGDTLEKLVSAFPPALATEHFDHLGDIDAFGGQIYGGLEDNAEPYGERYHRALIAYDDESLSPTAFALDPGAPNAPGDGDAPWVTVSPDGTWVVGGEWDPQESLMVWSRDDLLAGGEIETVARIPLDAPLARVQGCDFDGPRVLVCASDDAATGKLVTAIELSAPLDARANLTALTAQVEPLFPVPIPKNLCGIEAEVEGVDVNGDTLRVMVIGTCLLDTHIARYIRD